MGILVPNLIACENDPDTYKRQIKESLNSFKQFESELFHRAEFGIERRIERADSLLKRLEDLKFKINEIGSSSTLYFPSKLISPSESEFKVLSYGFLKIYQQNNITENILDMDYEKLRLLKDEAQSIRFAEIPERINVDTFQILDFKSKDRANLHALTRDALSHSQREEQTIDVQKPLSESCSTSTDSIISEDSEDLTDHELVDHDESPLKPELTFTMTSSTDIPAPPPAPPLPPSESISKVTLNNETLEKPQTGRANLLASIREGTKLKRVKSSEKKKPADSDLMSTLAAKLQTRRNKIVPLVSSI